MLSCVFHITFQRPCIDHIVNLFLLIFLVFLFSCGEQHTETTGFGPGLYIGEQKKDGQTLFLELKSVQSRLEGTIYSGAHGPIPVVIIKDRVVRHAGDKKQSVIHKISCDSGLCEGTWVKDGSGWRLQMIDPGAFKGVVNQSLIQSAVRIYTLQRAVSELQKKSASKLGELESLTTDSGAVRLKEENQRKIVTLKKQRQKFIDLLKDESSELRQTFQQYELALELSKKGRLVALARESLDRENRWLLAKAGIDSAVLTIGKEPPELVRGRRVISLRSQIKREKLKLKKLLGMQ